MKKKFFEFSRTLQIKKKEKRIMMIMNVGVDKHIPGIFWGNEKWFNSNNNKSDPSIHLCSMCKAI